MRPYIMSSSNEFVDPFMGLHKFRVVPTQDGEASVNKHLSLSLLASHTCPQYSIGSCLNICVQKLAVRYPSSSNICCEYILQEAQPLREDRDSGATRCQLKCC